MYSIVIIVIVIVIIVVIVIVIIVIIVVIVVIVIIVIVRYSFGRDERFGGEIELIFTNTRGRGINDIHRLVNIITIFIDLLILILLFRLTYYKIKS